MQFGVGVLGPANQYRECGVGVDAVEPDQQSLGLFYRGLCEEPATQAIDFLPEPRDVRGNSRLRTARLLQALPSVVWLVCTARPSY